jgi:hypothetical protein
MQGILADINVGGQQRALLAIWVSDAWSDHWNELGLIVESLPVVTMVMPSVSYVIVSMPRDCSVT